MEYIVKINEFEGPLDLLLHLIRKSEVDIYDISINDVTKQYIDYIHTMEKMNLEIASEYLVMAADLIRIKSTMLLPKPKIVEETEFEEDPKELLIQRLIEYKRYKEASDKFVDFKEERELKYDKVFNEAYEVSTPIILDVNVDTFDLVKALEKMRRRKLAQKPLVTVIEKHEITVEERMKQVESKLLTLKEKKRFSEMCDVVTRSYVITTFLAILELVKEDKIEIINITDDDFEIDVKKVVE